MKKHDATMICRLPAELHNKVGELCRATGKNQSVVLREGLLTVLKNWEAQKQERLLVSQF
jgi:predicted DNA-binding protein